MADFELPKNTEDIVEGKLLPAGLYRVRIVEEPELKANKKKIMGLSPEEGAGDNVVVKLRVQDKNPDFNGRAFTCYLPWPNKADEKKDPDRFTGQPVLDQKMERLKMWHAAFNGGVMPKGKNIKLEAGMEAKIQIDVGVDNRDDSEDPTPTNQIGFNTVPEPK